MKLILPLFIVYIFLCILICGTSDLFLLMLIVGLDIVLIYLIIDVLSKKPKKKDKLVAFRKMFGGVAS